MHKKIMLLLPLLLFGAARSLEGTWSIIIVDTRTREVAVGSVTCLQNFNLRALLDHWSIDKRERAAVPLKQVEHRLADLDPKGVNDPIFGDNTHHDQDAPEQDFCFLLGIERPLKLVFGEKAEVDQKLPKVLAGVIGGGADCGTIAQMEFLAD